MSFDEDARQSAEALTAHLGREIQDRLQEFVSRVTHNVADERHAWEHAASEERQELARRAADERDVLTQAAADERQAFAEQARQAVAAVEQTLDDAVTRAREDAIQETTTRFEADLTDQQAAIEREALRRQTLERESMLAGIGRLVHAFRRLDEGQSLSQLLDVLAEEAGRESPRCAVFVVRGRSLQGWAFSGFDESPADPRSLTFAIDAVPDLARVIDDRARRDVLHAPLVRDPHTPVAFLALRADDVGVAVPVSVGGQVAALVYADDGADDDQPVPALWPDTIELLARHAARCLEAQTAIRAARLSNGASAPLAAAPAAAGASTGAGAGVGAALVGSSPDAPYVEEHARRYARLLIADVRLHNEAAVRAGREARDLWQRLQPEITKARQSFDERVSEGLLHRDRIFEEELVRTLADGDETLLGFETFVPQTERLAG